jgi:hypothetical protein
MKTPPSIFRRYPLTFVDPLIFWVIILKGFHEKMGKAARFHYKLISHVNAHIFCEYYTLG